MNELIAKTASNDLVSYVAFLFGLICLGSFIYCCVFVSDQLKHSRHQMSRRAAKRAVHSAMTRRQQRYILEQELEAVHDAAREFQGRNFNASAQALIESDPDIATMFPQQNPVAPTSNMYGLDGWFKDEVSEDKLHEFLVDSSARVEESPCEVTITDFDEICKIGQELADSGEPYGQPYIQIDDAELEAFVTPDFHDHLKDYADGKNNGILGPEPEVETFTSEFSTILNSPDFLERLERLMAEEALKEQDESPLVDAEDDRTSGS